MTPEEMKRLTATIKAEDSHAKHFKETGKTIWDDNAGYDVGNVLKDIHPTTPFQDDPFPTGPAVNPTTTIDAKYGKKGSDYRAGMSERQAPAMILPNEMPPGMLRKEEDIQDS